MKKQSLSIAALIIGLGLLVAVPATALAQSPRPVRENAKQAREEFKNGEKREARADGQCVAITARINSRIKLFEDRKEMHLQNYRELKARLSSLVIKLKEKGYDTTAVEADLVTLDGKIKKAASDYATFIAKLEATKSHDCADANGAFKTALEEARTALEVFRADLKDLHTFAKETLRPHIKALRDQKPEKTRVEREQEVAE